MLGSLLEKSLGIQWEKLLGNKSSKKKEIVKGRNADELVKRKREYCSVTKL